LKVRDSSAMALDRRVMRCGVFGADGSAGVLRKNFMKVADLQSAGFQTAPFPASTNRRRRIYLQHTINAVRGKGQITWLVPRLILS
jgi:hypothetical protein